MHRRIYIAIGLVSAAAAAALFANTPAVLRDSTTPSALPDDIDAYLASSEHEVSSQFELIPGTEKRIRWQQPGKRTDYAVVYVHGFSATRQETAPLAERVADALHANLFETRLTGHGHSKQPMHGASAEDWMTDMAEALAIGARLGDRVVVIGTSTGATLALAMSGYADDFRITDFVLISPNIEHRDRAAGWLTRPGGPLLARLLVGETRTWTAHNDAQAKYWTTSYPVEAVIEVMRLVDYTRSQLPLDLDQGLLVFVSPEDTVVSPDATRQAFAGISAARKQLVEVRTAEDPGRHVLAGDILSPGTTDELAGMIVAFVAAGSTPEL